MSRCAATSHGERLPCYQEVGHEGETWHAWLNEAGEIAVAWLGLGQHFGQEVRLPADRPIAASR